MLRTDNISYFRPPKLSFLRNKCPLSAFNSGVKILSILQCVKNEILVIIYTKGKQKKISTVVWVNKQVIVVYCCLFTFWKIVSPQFMTPWIGQKRQRLYKSRNRCNGYATYTDSIKINRQGYYIRNILSDFLTADRLCITKYFLIKSYRSL